MGKENHTESEQIEIGRKIIVFIGPEGSGKTSIAKRLAQESGKPYITTGTGGIIEYYAKNDPGPIGDECRNMFEKNIYLSGETLLKVMALRFKEVDTANGFVLDGGLRTVFETQGFQKMLDDVGLNLELSVIYLDIPLYMSFERLVSGPYARKREKDTRNALSTRLSKFVFQFRKRLDIIQKEPNWKLNRIDADRNESQVYEDVKAVLRVSQ